ncbi:MAG: hydrogenase maturation protease [Verrucomicrobiae bacterium]|nr:hydrogenase maturation protease [Verrucomicrobiae bacterium]
MNLTSRREKPLILGVGNLLMGDEGIGVVAIRHLEARGFGAHAALVDGGTSGFHLLSLFSEGQRLILIDAATDGKPTGTVSLIRPRYSDDFPPTLTAHDIGLKDLIESAALLGNWPEVDLITISIGDLGLLTLELSPAVAAALPQIEALVKDCLEKHAAGPGISTLAGAGGQFCGDRGWNISANAPTAGFGKPG